MKKIKLIFLGFFNICFGESSLPKQDLKWLGSLTAGYVFKHDQVFKQVYGHGLANIITADLCYNLPEAWGIGAKVSYWRANGETSFLQLDTKLHEVPVTLYLRKMKNFNCGLQLYGSLGGGVICVREQSYLGNVSLNKGIGEIEAGLNYTIWRNMQLLAAVRYLFPSHSQCDVKIDLGGVDLRAGFGFTW